MIPVALVSKFALVFGGMAWEVFAWLVRGMLGLPVPSDFVHILTLLLAGVALQPIFDGVSSSLKFRHII